MKISAMRIGAIFVKECKEVRKCPPVMISFFMIPIISIIMKLALPDAGTDMIISMFYPMHIVLSGLLSCSSIMAEEKEKNTLRVLIMNRVKPIEYILGIGIFVFLGQMIGAVIVILIAEIPANILPVFIGITALGNVCSILLGSLIGVIVKNQVSVAPMAVPLMLLLTFVPIFSTENKGIRKVGSILYSQQISNLFNDLLQESSIKLYGILIILINLVLLFILFMIFYKRNKLDSI